MSSVNFSEMYLVPRDIYLRVLQSVSGDELRENFNIQKNMGGGELDFFSRKTLGDNYNNFIDENKDTQETGVNKNETENERNNLNPSLNNARNNFNPSLNNSQYFSPSAGDDMSLGENVRENIFNMPDFFSMFRNREKDISSSEGDINKDSKESKLNQSSSSSSDFSIPQKWSNEREKVDYPQFDEKFSKQKLSKSSSEKSLSSSHSKNSKADSIKLGQASAHSETSKASTHFENQKQESRKLSQSSNDSKTSKRSKKSNSSKNSRKKEKNTYPQVDPEYKKEKIERKPLKKQETKNTKKNRDETKKYIEKILSTHLQEANEIFDFPLNTPVSSIPELEKKFKKIRALIHPDKCEHPQSEEAFKKLTQAYELFVDYILVQEKKRKERNPENMDFSYTNPQETGNYSYARPQETGNYSYYNTGPTTFSYSDYPDSSQSNTGARPKTFFGSTRFASTNPYSKDYVKKTNKKKGPPLKTYQDLLRENTSSGLRPPKSASDFHKQYGSGFSKKWIKL